MDDEQMTTLANELGPLVAMEAAVMGAVDGIATALREDSARILAMPTDKAFDLILHVLDDSVQFSRENIAKYKEKENDNA